MGSSSSTSSFGCRSGAPRIARSRRTRAPEARFTMCDYVTAADERFGLSRIEIDRDGPSYTVDTLRELRGRSPDDELFLILGGDQAAAMPEVWREPEEVMRLATVAVAERAESDRARVEGRARGYGERDVLRHAADRRLVHARA